MITNDITILQHLSIFAICALVERSNRNFGQLTSSQVYLCPLLGNKKVILPRLLSWPVGIPTSLYLPKRFMLLLYFSFYFTQSIFRRRRRCCRRNWSCSTRLIGDFTASFPVTRTRSKLILEILFTFRRRPKIFGAKVSEG